MDSKRVLGSDCIKRGLSKTWFSSCSVVEEETRRSQQAARDKQSPSQANGCSDHRPIDILEMLSRAKDEYERVRLCMLSGRTKGRRRPAGGSWAGEVTSRASGNKYFKKKTCLIILSLKDKERHFLTSENLECSFSIPVKLLWEKMILDCRS